MKKTVLFLAAFALWFLLTLPFDPQGAAAGTLAALLTALIFGNLFTGTAGKFLQPKRWFWTLYYIPVFVYYMILANLDVMYRVFHPALPIKPGIVKVKTKLKCRAGRTVLCNSITLTPGTLTVDISGEYLYIHWINVRSFKTETATELIVEKFEKILERIFE